MSRVKLISGTLLAIMLTAWAVGVDVPGDEATNRKLLAMWKSDPDRLNRLQQNVTLFQSLPRDRQEQLREMDRMLHQFDPSTQARLRSVMERYAGWLNRLSKEDQAKIAEASAGLERLKVVQEILERQWQESLTTADQQKLSQATAEERSKLLEKLHAEDDDRRRLRAQARRTIEEAAVLGPLPFGQPAFREQVQIFLDESLRPLLNRAEEDRLNKAIDASNVRKFQSIFELAEGKTPLPFPGPAPYGRKKALRSWQDLPVSISEKFPDPVPSRIRDAEGKWPQFPLAVAAEAKQGGITLDWKLLGPSKLDELPSSVQKFVRDELTSKLTDNEKHHLKDAEGKWPDYPKRIKELADKHRLIVPGLSLPGPRDLWQGLSQRARPGKAGFP